MICCDTFNEIINIHTDRLGIGQIERQEKKETRIVLQH